MLVAVLSWASLAFCSRGCLRAKPDRDLFTGMSVLLRGCSEDGLNLVRPLLCPFGRRKIVF